MLIVMKFGGSSLATAERLNKAAALIAAQRQAGDDVVAVVSAQGDCTDHLLAQADEVTSMPALREKDVLLSCGEQMSMALMAMALEEQGCKALSFCGWQAGIMTESRHGNAAIRSISPHRIQQALKEGNVAVIAGFQGINEQGEITTIGRGGSDTTAVALAAALKAERCRIYTDVPGVCSADPRTVAEALLYREIPYDEMLEMAALGAGVLHPRAVRLAKEKGVCLEVRSSFSPELAGTTVALETPKKCVRGVTVVAPIAMITLRGFTPGRNSAALFARLEEWKAEVDTVIRGEETQLSFSLPQAGSETLLALLKEAQEAIGFQTVTCREGLCKVSLVGGGLSEGSDIAAKMLFALAEREIFPTYITAGPLSLSVILPESEKKSAVQALHKTFFRE